MGFGVGQPWALILALLPVSLASLDTSVPLSEPWFSYLGPLAQGRSQAAVPQPAGRPLQAWD